MTESPRDEPVSSGRRLDSWKEIAAYLRRDVKTARRWEKHEGLPVHRHHHDALGSVYAFESEIEAWRVNRRAPAAPVPRTPRRSPFLAGRDRELAVLTAALERARSGWRQVVLISGELGIGKTALVHKFLDALDESTWCAEGQSVEQFGAGEAYLPILDAVARIAADGDRAVVDAIVRYAPSWCDALLGRRLPSEPGSEERAEQRGPARELCALVEALARLRPLVLVVEDLHWSDRASLDLLGRLTRRTESLPLMIVTTCRAAAFGSSQPDAWRGVQELRSHFQLAQLDLGRLDRDAIKQYLESQGRWNELDEATDWFARRSEGNPLFLVHLFQHCVQTGIARLDAEWTLARDEGASMLPHTLRALIESHVASLNDGSRRVLEMASVAGDRFPSALIAGVTEVDVAGAEEALEHLASRGEFVEADGAIAWPDGTTSGAYRFGHQYYRQVLYDSIPAGTRASMHLRIADRLERAYGDRTPDIAPELAMHFEHGGDRQRAIARYRDANDHALLRGASHEAYRCATSALTLLRELPEGPARDLQELELRLRLCSTLTTLHNMVHPAVAAAVDDTVSVAARVPDAVAAMRALAWMGRLTFMAGNVGHAEPLMLDVLRRARTSGHGLASALAELSIARLAKGDLAGATGFAREAVDVPDENSDRAAAGFDAAQMALNVLAWSAWMQGSITECRAFIDRCNRRAQERTEPVGIAFAEGWAAPLLEYCGDGEHSSALLASSVAIGARFRLEQVRLWTAAVGGWIEARRGRTKAGVATLREAVAGVEKAGLRTWVPWVQSWFAEALLLHGEAGEAIVVTTRALESAAAMGAHFYDAELLRLRGEALQALGQREQSVTTLLEAIAAAERQGAATLAARASSALASLHGEQV